MISAISDNSFSVASNHLLARAFGHGRPVALQRSSVVGRAEAVGRHDRWEPSGGEASRAPEAEPRGRLARNADGDSFERTSNAPGGTEELTEDQQREVERLRQRDAEVRLHEQAHKAAGGELAGSPQYEYTTGPDGNRYATSGSVSIDTSPVPGDPEATIAKARRIRAAAFAPAEPSSADRAVAAKAQQMEAKAHRELAEQQRSEPTERADASTDRGGAADRGGASEPQGVMRTDVHAAATYGRAPDAVGLALDTLA
jgi:hypothetical protein